MLEVEEGRNTCEPAQTGQEWTGRRTGVVWLGDRDGQACHRGPYSTCHLPFPALPSTSHTPFPGRRTLYAKHPDWMDGRDTPLRQVGWKVGWDMGHLAPPHSQLLGMILNLLYLYCCGWGDGDGMGGLGRNRRPPTPHLLPTGMTRLFIGNWRLPFQTI